MVHGTVSSGVANTRRHIYHQFLYARCCLMQAGTPGFSPPEGGNNSALHRRLFDRGVVPCHGLSFDYYMLGAALLSVLLRKNNPSGQVKVLHEYKSDVLPSCMLTLVEMARAQHGDVSDRSSMRLLSLAWKATSPLPSKRLEGYKAAGGQAGFLLRQFPTELRRSFD